MKWCNCLEYAIWALLILFVLIIVGSIVSLLQTPKYSGGLGIEKLSIGGIKGGDTQSYEDFQYKPEWNSKQFLQNVKKIKLSTPRDEKFKPPKDMIVTDSDDPNTSTKNYAFMTLVMINDIYIPAALVLADSLRRHKTKAELVVMVTPDISEEGKKQLKLLFDKVIEVEYLKVQSDRKHDYLSYVCTKFHLLNMTQYKKIIFLDADAIVNTNIDDLFSVPAPAGTIIPHKNDYIVPNDKYNKFYDDIYKGDIPSIPWYNMYANVLYHGAKIPKSFTDKAKTDRNFCGVAAGMWVLEPDPQLFDEIIQDLNDWQTRKYISGCRWPEQQYLTWKLSGKWHSINPIYLGLQAFPHMSVTKTIQYAGLKPWEIKFNDLSEIHYPDFRIWHELLRDLIKKKAPKLDALKPVTYDGKYIRVRGKSCSKCN